MTHTIGGNTRVGSQPAKIREIKDGKARCEWIEGTELKDSWYPLDLLPEMASDHELAAEAARNRRRQAAYDADPLSDNWKTL